MPQIGGASQALEPTSWMAETLLIESEEAKEDLVWMRYLPKLTTVASKAPRGSWISAALSKLAKEAVDERGCEQGQGDVESALQEGAVATKRDIWDLTYAAVSIASLLGAALVYERQRVLEAMPLAAIPVAAAVALGLPVTAQQCLRRRRAVLASKEDKTA